ncbi:MAG: PKD domain-containing protein, partial [Flammeovirgaceae bacterium]
AKGFSILLLDMEELEKRHLATHGHIYESDGHESNEAINGHYFEIHLIGSNRAAKAETDQALQGYHNYFIGSDSCKWASNARAYGTIIYKNIYEGIDFRISSVGKNLKYDFIVQPEADPAQIKIEYCGVDGIEKMQGALKVTTSVGTLTELKPISYRGSESQTQEVPTDFHVDGNLVTFSFPEDYDHCETLTIDPLLIFSTYSGSSADNWGSTATPGEHGTLYSAGVTHQQLGGVFPATPGAFQTINKGVFDMAVIKYDSAGTRFLYATLLGGTNNDSPVSLVVDKTSNDLIVLGLSSSINYPTGVGSFDNTFNGGTTIFNRVLNTDDQWDIVVTRLPPTGDRLIGSTFLGGSGNDGLNHPKQLGGPLVANYGDEMRGDVITDDSGNVYISSVTGSSNFPIVNGFDNSFNGGTTDGIVVKLSPDLSSIVWSSYLGGSGFDAAYSIKFDSNQNVVLAGGTTSVNFPVTTGAYQTAFKGIVDGWIARISSDGSSIMHATFTGTNSFDQVYFVDLNSSGNIYCYGQTAGQMPTTAGVYKNVNSGQFLQKLSADLSKLEFSTVFGSGSGNGIIIPNISPTAFLVNECDNIYMAGWGGFVNSSPSTGFWQSSTFGMPVTNDAYQQTTSGSDFYFIVLNGDATQLVYSTYLGAAPQKRT